MKKIIFIATLIFTFNVTATYHWAAAVPDQVHIVPDGLILIGDFNRTDITCATGSKAIYLPKSDPNFDAKLTLALTAKATGKEIKVLLLNGADSKCTQISALGFVPHAYYYYWQLMG